MLCARRVSIGSTNGRLASSRRGPGRTPRSIARPPKLSQAAKSSRQVHRYPCLPHPLAPSLPPSTTYLTHCTYSAMLPKHRLLPKPLPKPPTLGLDPRPRHRQNRPVHAPLTALVALSLFVCLLLYMPSHLVYDGVCKRTCRSDAQGMHGLTLVFSPCLLSPPSSLPLPLSLPPG